MTHDNASTAKSAEHGKKGKNTKKATQYVKNDVGTKRADLKIRGNHVQKPNRNDKETEKI